MEEIKKINIKSSKYRIVDNRLLLMYAFLLHQKCNTSKEPSKFFLFSSTSPNIIKYSNKSEIFMFNPSPYFITDSNASLNLVFISPGG